MVQNTMETKYAGGNENFPILFEDDHMRVYKNPANEIFVEDIQSGATMRISSYPLLDGGLRFTTKGRVEPIPVANMIGWRISPR